MASATDSYFIINLFVTWADHYCNEKRKN